MYWHRFYHPNLPATNEPIVIEDSDDGDESVTERHPPLQLYQSPLPPPPPPPPRSSNVINHQPIYYSTTMPAPSTLSCYYTPDPNNSVLGVAENTVQAYPKLILPSSTTTTTTSSHGSVMGQGSLPFYHTQHQHQHYHQDQNIQPRYITRSVAQNVAKRKWEGVHQQHQTPLPLPRPQAIMAHPSSSSSSAIISAATPTGPLSIAAPISPTTTNTSNTPRYNLRVSTRQQPAPAPLDNTASIQRPQQQQQQQKPVKRRRKNHSSSC